MKRTGKTVLLFGIYLMLLGLAFITIPGLILEFIKVDPVPDFWPRVLGMFILFLGYFYVRASFAGDSMRCFFRWTVHTRFMVVIIFGIFVYYDIAGPGILLFGVIDLLGALWTRAALNSSRYAFNANLKY